eukprot:8384993-Lingulodinium_polyedra.AAC.1
MQDAGRCGVGAGVSVQSVVWCGRWVYDAAINAVRSPEDKVALRDFHQAWGRVHRVQLGHCRTGCRLPGVRWSVRTGRYACHLVRGCCRAAQLHQCDFGLQGSRRFRTGGVSSVGIERVVFRSASCELGRDVGGRAFGAVRRDSRRVG